MSIDLFSNFGAAADLSKDAVKPVIFKSDEEARKGFQPENYFIDIPNYVRAHFSDTYPPNIQFFSQENLSTFAGMEWIGQTNMHLYSPTSEDLSVQRQELETLYSQLESQALIIKHEAAPSCFPKGYSERIIGADLETTGLDTRVVYDETGQLCPLTKIVGICLATSPNDGWYLPVMHTQTDGVLNWDYSLACEFLSRINMNFLTVWHNSQYDREVQALNGVEQRPFPFFLDTQLLDFLFDVNDKAHGLKILSEKRLGRKMIEIDQLLSMNIGGKKKAQDYIHFNRLPATSAYVYGCSDAMNTLQLCFFFSQQPDIDNSFKSQPTPLIVDHKMSDCLRNIYRQGMPVDLEYYYYAALTTCQRIMLLEDAMYSFVGWKFTFGQNDLNVVLFEQFRIPPLPEMEKSAKGLYSTDEDTMDALYEKYPDMEILRMIVSYRKLTGVYSKIYLKALVNSYVDFLQPNTRVQFQFSQTVIPTGRLSSASSKGVERIKVTPTKTGALSVKYLQGSGDCGFNAQGVNAVYGNTVKVRRIKKLPPSVDINVDNLYPEAVRIQFYKDIVNV